MTSIFYIILAILGIDFLILIHELGHYYMARKLGITVEEFAVGFGKPLVSWTWNGVKWKIGMIPFGGYVKMAGMEKEGMLDPRHIEGGFLAQKPWNQIKVAAIGPIVNIVFAFFAFSLLWVMGGREKPFSEFTNYIGWVGEESGLYRAGIRAGDLIETVNQQPFQTFDSFLYRALTEKGPLGISGQEIDWREGSQDPFTYVFEEGKNLESMDKALRVLSTLDPAQYLIYDWMPNGAPNALMRGSPLESSGICYGDRIVWVDGKLIFSKRELIETINTNRVLLTVLRNGKTFLTRVPRLPVADLRLTAREKEEIDDFRAAAQIGQKVDTLDYVPYTLTASVVVKEPLPFIDDKSRFQTAFLASKRTQGEISLRPGDKILAVAGKPVASSQEFIREMQERRVLILVDQMGKRQLIPWKKVQETFDHSFDMAAIRTIVDTVGTASPLMQAGSFRLLQPVKPIRLQDFPLPKAQAERQRERIDKRREEIIQISDPRLRQEALGELKTYQNRLMLGVTLQDRAVAYNPSPFFLIGDVFGQIVKTFQSLVTGSLSPKYMTGFIGIVQVLQFGWSQGVKEALYFLGMISLNLGIINFLPIPVLDGGHITFALWEMITKKPIPIKTREWLIFPFIFLLIAVFVYFSFNDIVRIMTRFF